MKKDLEIKYDETNYLSFTKSGDVRVVVGGKQPMDITELKARKSKLEKQIQALLVDFETETKTNISDVEVIVLSASRIGACDETVIGEVKVSIDI